MGVPGPSDAVRAQLAADPELEAYVEGMITDCEKFVTGVAAQAGYYRRRLEALLATMGGDVVLDLDLGPGETRFAGHALKIEESGSRVHRMRLIDPEEVAAGRRAGARAIAAQRAEGVPEDQRRAERAATLAALRRATWREDGRIVRLMAANRDGGAVLASIDTSDQFRYAYTLADGRTGAGWPLAPVQRAVRKLLREAE